MKLQILLFLLLITLVFTSCSLEEEPPYLSNANVYSSAETASAAVDGMYRGLIEYGYYGNQFMVLNHLSSGFGVTRRGGTRNNTADNSTLSSLKPTSNSLQLKNSWRAIYNAIARNNDAIASIDPMENPVSLDELVINDAIGHAYFLRAFNYFNLVRLWGEVPLRTAPALKETINLAKSPISDIYAQIIADAKLAQKYMNGNIGNGTPQKYAADMLLAKVYMTLATAPSSHQPESGDYWQLAYKEAINVYGIYSLINYGDLFKKETSNNTSESIFELKSSLTATLDHTRAFTPNWYTGANTFGWLLANISVYNRHRAAYPDDPRIDATYISTWTRQNNGTTQNCYPVNASRSFFGNSFPYILKLGSQDPTNVARETTKNFKVYRYSDLLLMLSEISNELQNGQQLGYVTEVLDRVGQTPGAEYSNGQASFREAIMREYEFELMAEGHASFNNRRRGYAYFLNNVILPHNNDPLFDPNVDVTLETTEDIVMFLPISQNEIDRNELVTE